MTKDTMKKLLLFLGALALQAQTVSLSDTLTNAVGGGGFTGRITVTLNAPASAQPLYYSTTSLTGWQAVYCIGVTGADCTTTTSAGTFAATLYANSTITPAGTSYSARFQPAKGAAWSEVWTVEAADTKLYQIRATAVPSPTVMFQPSQLTAGGASNGSCLVYDGTTWEPAACASGGGSGTVTSVAATVPSILAVTGSPITSSGTLAFSLATQAANQVFAGPTSGGAATPTFRALASADIPANAANTSGNAATATALAANGANCSAGSFPLGVDASGASETCTALPTTISGTANEITASASTGAVTLSLSSTVNLSSKTLRVPNGTFLPGGCTVGDSYMDTDATTGLRWYLCESTNTWVAQGGGSSAPGPDTLYTFEEDFLYWSTTSGAKGEKTWWYSSGTNANSGWFDGEVTDHPGQIRLAILDVGNHQLYWGGTSNRFNFAATQNWIFLIRADETSSSYSYKCGLSSDPETHPASEEAVIEKATADTNWFYRTRAAGTSSTRVDSTAAVSTSWIALKIRKSGSTWYFSTASTLAGLTGATELSIATNIPTGAARPFCYSTAAVSGWKGMYWDYVRGQVTISR